MPNGKWDNPNRDTKSCVVQGNPQIRFPLCQEAACSGKSVQEPRTILAACSRGADYEGVPRGDCALNITGHGCELSGALGVAQVRIDYVKAEYDAHHCTHM